MGRYWNGSERCWYAKPSGSVPTIAVSDLSDEAKRERDKKVKDGARVVPFGFSRVLTPEPEQSLQMTIDDCIEVAATGSDGKPPVRKMRPIRSDATRTRQAKARTKAKRDGQ